MADTTETTKVSKVEKILDRTIGWFKKIKRIVWRGMYKRKGKLRHAVNFGYGREIDTSNDIGSRLSPYPKTSQRTHDIGMISLFLR